jgi:hypothetical protein
MSRMGLATSSPEGSEPEDIESVERRRGDTIRFGE